MWTRLESGQSPSLSAAYSGPISISEPLIQGHLRVHVKVDASPELSPRSDSGVTPLEVSCFTVKMKISQFL